MSTWPVQGFKGAHLLVFLSESVVVAVDESLLRAHFFHTFCHLDSLREDTHARA